MKTAKEIKKLNWSGGDARLYKLSESINYHHEHETEYVIVSAVNNSYAHETYIFPANINGEELDMGELRGSFRGDMDHARALEGLGFTIKD